MKEKFSKDLKIFLNYRRVKEIKRCNNFSVIHVEDVAQHSFYTALYAMYIASEYNKNVGAYNMQFHHYDCDNPKQTFNVDEVVRRALVHDLEESFTSDIPYNVKHHSEEANAIIKSVVKSKMEELFEGANDINLDILNTSMNDKAGFDGKLIAVVDMLELAIYSSEEVYQGNRCMQPMLDKCVRLIESYDIYEDLVEFSPTFKELMEMLHGEEDSLAEAYGSMIDIS